MLAVSILLDQIRPRTIIEIGTGAGGLSIFLGLWANVHGAKFVTYDRNDQRHHPHLFRMLEIDFRAQDVFDVAEDIGALIALGGSSLVICDGGDKNKEIQYFGPRLKLGDHLIVHDYARTKEEFAEKIRPHFWDWHESEERVGVEAGLTPVFQQLMEYAAWGCFIKDKE